MEGVRFLVEDINVDVEVRNNNGQTAFDVALWQANLDVVKFLAKHTHFTEDSVISLLFDMVGLSEDFSPYLKCIEHLVQTKKIDINKPNRDGHSALSVACLYGKIELVKFLVLQCKAEIDYYIFYQAAFNHYNEVVCFLKSQGKTSR